MKQNTYLMIKQIFEQVYLVYVELSNETELLDQRNSHTILVSGVHSIQ